MARARSAQNSFILGAWRVDPGVGEITPRVGGEAVRFEPRQMDLLLLFAGSGGRVVTKDEIVAQVWSGRAIGDDTLASAISKLRKALGASKRDRYIETLPKRGYRLVASVGEGVRFKRRPRQSQRTAHARRTRRRPRRWSRKVWRR